MEKMYPAFQSSRHRPVVMLACLLLLISATLGVDFLYTRIKNSSFYFSESLLFSSYWLLFPPLLMLQRRITTFTAKTVYSFVAFILPLTLHFLIYPALISVLSFFLFDHTFLYRQTFNYGITAYLIQAAIIYGLPVLVNRFYRERHVNLNPQPEALAEMIPVPGIFESLIVSDGNNKKIPITVSEVLYFSANSPYVGIHHPLKKYLYTSALKSLELRLDKNIFIRIHKSVIVNLGFVAGYQSRLNGDYDLTLMNGTILRLSRNYAADFKTKFEERHRFTVK